MPAIDKPTRVDNNSATLIDNILTNKIDVEITRVNIICDISDHFSQFCIFQSFYIKLNSTRRKYLDFSCFSEIKFNCRVSVALSDLVISDAFLDVDTTFSQFYNILMTLVDKHAPLKTVSNRKLKEFSKPLNNDWY